jgi:ribosomal protein S18 acetylase RimI-like enzyme
MIEVSLVDEVTPELVSAFARLLPQLTLSSPPPTEADLRAVVEADATFLLVARELDPQGRGQIAGSVTLVVFAIPGGTRARIESLVVDEDARGRGVGEALLRAALARAQALHARSVDLTSSPRREAAQRLYQRLGFERRETNVYRLLIKRPP